VEVNGGDRARGGNNTWRTGDDGRLPPQLWARGGDDGWTGRSDGHQAHGGSGVKELAPRHRTLASGITSIDSSGQSTLAVSGAP
jgi:hypothetical protein